MLLQLQLQSDMLWLSFLRLVFLSMLCEQLSKSCEYQSYSALYSYLETLFLTLPRLERRDRMIELEADMLQKSDMQSSSSFFSYSSLAYSFISLCTLDRSYLDGRFTIAGSRQLSASLLWVATSSFLFFSSSSRSRSYSFLLRSSKVMASSSFFRCLCTKSMISSGLRAERGSSSNLSPLAIGIITFYLDFLASAYCLAIYLISYLEQLTFGGRVLLFLSWKEEGVSGLYCLLGFQFLLKVMKLPEVGVGFCFFWLLLFRSLSWESSQEMQLICGTRIGSSSGYSLVNSIMGGLLSKGSSQSSCYGCLASTAFGKGCPNFAFCRLAIVCMFFLRSSFKV